MKPRRARRARKVAARRIRPRRWFEILVVKRLRNPSDEQVEFQVLDRMSFQRFCGLSQSASIPNLTTVWTSENRIGEKAAHAVFDGVQRQPERKGYLARCGQIVDATIIASPKQLFTREE